MAAFLNHNTPLELEKKRIEEIRNTSYQERIFQLMTIIKLTFELKNTKKTIVRQ